MWQSILYSFIFALRLFIFSWFILFILLWFHSILIPFFPFFTIYKHLWNQDDDDNDTDQDRQHSPWTNPLDILSKNQSYKSDIWFRKCAIIPGIITVIWHAIITPMDTNPPTNDAKNPTIREFGA